MMQISPATPAPSAPLLAGVGCARIFVWGSIGTLLASILPHLSERAGLTLEQAGQVFLANGLGLVTASLVAGPLIDIGGKKSSLFAGFLLAIGSLLLLTRADTRAAIMALAFPLSTGGSPPVIAANATVSDL